MTDTNSQFPPKSDEQADELANEAAMEKRLKNYRDVDGVTTRTLSFGVWYMKHRRTFFLAAVWFLAILATVLWAYSLYYFGYYLLVGMKNDRATINVVAENPLALEQRKLMSQVSYGFIQAVDLGRNSYSLIGEFSSNNAVNWAIFDYYFLVDGQRIGSSTSYILPKDKKFITSVIDNLSAPPETVRLMVTNFRWNKYDQHVITDWQQYKSDRLDFVVLDKKFVGSTQSALSDRLPVNSLSFNISNRTAYGYREAPLQIILYSGSEAVYVKDYIINNFASKDRKEVTLSLIGNFPNINRIEIIPDINIFDQSNYLTN